MTYEETINVIVRQISEVAKEFAPDKTVVVCPERIFVDDYLPKEEQYVAHNHELPSLDADDPNEPPYYDKIFIVVKLGSGQKNMALSNSVATIQVLSENNDFLAARDILDAFTSKYNFQYENGIVQAYFTPEISSSQESVYTGFRALMSVRGFVRIPTDGFAFVTKLYITVGDAEERQVLPFLNISYNYSAQPDPQAFAGYNGQALSLNRQSTEVVSFSTYLRFSDADPGMRALSEAILNARNDMNKKFKIIGASAIPSINLVEGWFVLASIHYDQDLGDMAPWVLGFARAKEVED